VSHFRAGMADINQEFTSNENPAFVLHDSMGFESGSKDSFEIVENFIKERKNKPELSEQLHAIWLCTSVSVAGSRIFEAGDERIFSMNLGHAPLIVVFTKYDEFTDKALYESQDLDGDDDDKSESQLGAQAEERARLEFENTCVKPLSDVCAQRQLPLSIGVSVRDGHEERVSHLIKLTLEHVAQQVRVPWAIAQRSDVDTKVEASIYIGRSRYWKDLFASTHFGDKKMVDCLYTLHIDITMAWNFYDPSGHLSNGKTRALMSCVIEDLIRPSTNPAAAFQRPYWSGDRYRRIGCNISSSCGGSWTCCWGRGIRKMGL